MAAEIIYILKRQRPPGSILPLPQLKVKVQNGKECFAPCMMRIEELKIRCHSRENLEYEGAKSSFQKGLGSKSRFLKISKILSFQGLKSSLDIKFQFLNSQRCSGKSKTSVMMVFEKKHFFHIFHHM